MPWWSWRPGSAASNEQSDTGGGEVAVQSTVRVGVPAQREPSRSGVPSELSTPGTSDPVTPVQLTRVGKALDLLDTLYAIGISRQRRVRLLERNSGSQKLKMVP